MGLNADLRIGPALKAKSICYIGRTPLQLDSIALNQYNCLYVNDDLIQITLKLSRLRLANGNP